MSTQSVTTPAAGVAAEPRGHWIDDWRPEDPAFWEATGERVARRNLVFSILSEHVGFCVWSLWSVFVLFLGPDYGFDPAQKFLLTAAPAAVGAVLRIPYTLAVARFGGRNWTIISALLLLVPCVAAGIVLEPGVSFGTLLAVACLAGVGGGNFASSMANIDAFYPQRLKGWALGLNAGGGNLGVAAVQLVGLAVLATAGSDEPRLVLLRLHPAGRGGRGLRGALHGQPDAGPQRAPLDARRRCATATPGSCRSSTSGRSARSSASASRSARCCWCSSPTRSTRR